MNSIAISNNEQTKQEKEKAFFDNLKSDYFLERIFNYIEKKIT